MNPLSELIIDLYGTDSGSHARTAVGVAPVPLNLPVVISAEVEIAPPIHDALWVGQLHRHAQGMRTQDLAPTATLSRSRSVRDARVSAILHMLHTQGLSRSHKLSP
jgi:hypothetical protein